MGTIVKYMMGNRGFYFTCWETSSSKFKARNANLCFWNVKDLSGVNINDNISQHLEGALISSSKKPRGNLGSFFPFYDRYHRQWTSLRTSGVTAKPRPRVAVIGWRPGAGPRWLVPTGLYPFPTGAQLAERLAPIRRRSDLTASERRGRRSGMKFWALVECLGAAGL